MPLRLMERPQVARSTETDPECEHVWYRAFGDYTGHDGAEVAVHLCTLCAETRVSRLSPLSRR